MGGKKPQPKRTRRGQPRACATLPGIVPPTLINGDCLVELAKLPENSVDTCITDPPYELAFMGKQWDGTGIAFDPETRKAVYRVLKPGAFLLCFGGTRTFHRIACAIEEAGFELRDCMMWLYGSGFPKSLDISKAIDKSEGVEYLRTFKSKNPADRPYTHQAGETSTGWQSPPRPDKTHPHSEAAKEWDGWGSALKPAHEPIIVAMKPLDGTFAQNALKWGVAGLNIDGGRIPSEPWSRPNRQTALGRMNDDAWQPTPMDGESHPQGRFPANIILSCTCGQKEHQEECPCGMLDEQSGVGGSGSGVVKVSAGGSERTESASLRAGSGMNVPGKVNVGVRYFGDTGGASRFFYVAKAGKKERAGSTHPTMKPLKLMEYLSTLTKTPTGGGVLDPFLGSGTTALAAINTGREIIGIEKEAEYFAIAKRRVENLPPRLIAG